MKGSFHQRGFTLFELMVTVGLGAVLIGLATPSILQFSQASQLAGSSRDLVVDFSIARNEAVMRAQRVTVCTSANMTSCANTSWALGRLVFVDGGAVGSIGGTDQVLTRTPALPAAAAVTRSGIATSGYVSFLPNGRLTGVGIVNVCVPGQTERRISLHRTGQATLNRTTIAC